MTYFRRTPRTVRSRPFAPDTAVWNCTCIRICSLSGRLARNSTTERRRWQLTTTANEATTKTSWFFTSSGRVQGSKMRCETRGVRRVPSRRRCSRAQTTANIRYSNRAPFGILSWSARVSDVVSRRINEKRITKKKTPRNPSSPVTESERRYRQTPRVLSPTASATSARRTVATTCSTLVMPSCRASRSLEGVTPRRVSVVKSMYFSRKMSVSAISTNRPVPPVRRRIIRP